MAEVEGEAMEPPGLPPLTVHSREGYYAPTQ